MSSQSHRRTLPLGAALLALALALTTTAAARDRSGQHQRRTPAAQLPYRRPHRRGALTQPADHARVRRPGRTDAHRKRTGAQPTLGRCSLASRPGRPEGRVRQLLGR